MLILGYCSLLEMQIFFSPIYLGQTFEKAGSVMSRFNSQHINSKLTVLIFHMEINKIFSTLLQCSTNIPSAILPRRKWATSHSWCVIGKRSRKNWEYTTRFYNSCLETQQQKAGLLLVSARHVLYNNFLKHF